MNFKKLNEQLERYLPINEISAELAKKVKQKRIDQLNKLQKKVEKDTEISHDKTEAEIRKILPIIEDWMKKKFKKVEKNEYRLGGFNPYTEYTYIGLEIHYKDWDDFQGLECQTSIASYFGKNADRFSNKFRRVEGVTREDFLVFSPPFDANNIIKSLEKEYETHKKFAEQMIDINNEILKILQEDPDIQMRENISGMEMHGGGACYAQNGGSYKGVWFNTIYETHFKHYKDALNYEIELYTGFQGSTKFNSVEDFKTNYKKILERTYKRRVKKNPDFNKEQKQTRQTYSLAGPIIKAGTYYKDGTFEPAENE